MKLNIHDVRKRPRIIFAVVFYSHNVPGFGSGKEPAAPFGTLDSMPKKDYKFVRNIPSENLLPHC